jgi:hypothetical protein
VVLLPSTGFSDPGLLQKVTLFRIRRAKCMTTVLKAQYRHFQWDASEQPLFFFIRQANVPGKDNVSYRRQPTSSSMMATGEEKRSPARALGMVILAFGGITNCTSDPVRCWPAGTCPGFSIGEARFAVSFLLVSEVRKKASISRM